MIGIFDSGFGGLTVLREYLKKYPEFDYLYLGDQANSPYGGRSPERILELVQGHVDFMVKKGCKLIILACNTASADALRSIQSKYQGKPAILGVLVPAVETALEISTGGRLAVIGTRGTVQSGAYEREIRKYAASHYSAKTSGNGKVRKNRPLPAPKVISQACPLLVPLVEEGKIGHPATRMILKNYLRPLREAHVDTLILGCTHYPLLEKEIKKVMGNRVEIVSSARAAADAIEDWFERHPQVRASLRAGGSRTFYTTDCPERFSELGSRFLGSRIQAERC